jgi:putative Holliday junction resolvase
MIYLDSTQFINACKLNASNSAILGLDIGQKKIGIAIFKTAVKMVIPLEVYLRQSLKKDLIYFQGLIKEKNAAGIVIGLPISLNSEENDNTKFVRKFGEELVKAIEMPVYFQDERMSTSYANRLLMETGLNRKERNAIDDKFSAAAILESFLKRSGLF